MLFAVTAWNFELRCLFSRSSNVLFFAIVFILSLYSNRESRFLQCTHVVGPSLPGNSLPGTDGGCEWDTRVCALFLEPFVYLEGLTHFRWFCFSLHFVSATPHSEQLVVAGRCVYRTVHALSLDVPRVRSCLCFIAKRVRARFMHCTPLRTVNISLPALVRFASFGNSWFRAVLPNEPPYRLLTANTTNLSVSQYIYIYICIYIYTYIYIYIYIYVYVYMNM